MAKKAFWFSFLVLLSVGSYYRELLFESINAIMMGERSFYASTTALPMLYDWNYDSLIQLKYILTILFTAFFMLISSIGLKISFYNRLPYYIILILYGTIIITIVFALICGLLVLEFQSVYPFLRKLIGLVHNPLPFLLISIGYIAFISIHKVESS